MITTVRPLTQCPVPLVRPGDVVEDWKGETLTVTAVQPTSRGAWLDCVGRHGAGVQWMPASWSVGLVATEHQVLEAVLEAAYAAAEQVLT